MDSCAFFRELTVTHDYVYQQLWKRIFARKTLQIITDDLQQMACVKSA
ncbi:MAG: hypothetical protein RL007_1298 [Bacteroidota bacterium]|jgi:hypothetical protein